MLQLELQKWKLELELQKWKLELDLQKWKLEFVSLYLNNIFKTLQYFST